jgi:hypothetical protein
MKFPFFLLTLFLAGSTHANLYTADTLIKDFINPLYYACNYTKQPIKVDGDLQDASWRDAPWTSDFVQLYKDDHRLPPSRTRMKMMWDDSYFYFGAEMEEKHIRADFKQRDTVICLENDFEIFIDPNGDNHEYLEFEMNALQTVWDLILTKAYRDGGEPLSSYDIDGLLTGVKINGTLNDASDIDSGWSCEVAIPWKAFEKYAHRSIPPKSNEQWRLNFLRVQYKPEIENNRYKPRTTPPDNLAWSPHRTTNMHDPETFGIVQFNKDKNQPIIPDASLEARGMLMQVYYAQKKYFAANKRYASTLKDLGLTSLDDKHTVLDNQFQVTDKGFVARAVASNAGKNQTWHIDELSRLWMESK